MKPFKVFFGLAIAVILFSYLIKIAFVAFIAAAIMSVFYAIYRRIKDFVTYDSYGDYYLQGCEYEHPRSRMKNHWRNGVEPLFQESPRGFTAKNDAYFIKVI